MTDLQINAGATYDTSAYGTRVSSSQYYPEEPEPTAPTAPSAEALQFFTTMAAYLRQAGLGDLAVVGADGAPSGWLWDQILSGVDTSAELQIALESTAQFQREFGVILEQRARAARGEPTQVMSVDEVVAYRQTAA